jgi:hypothetical protein
MNHRHDYIDFEDVINEMSQPRIGPGGLTALGGNESFSPETARRLLTAWGIPRPDMPWGVWEFMDEITPIQGVESIREDLEYLERVRVFGRGGDVEVRRDGDRLLWRFVGPGGLNAPAGFAALDYWAAHPEPLHRRELTTLLWGEYDPEAKTWREDRVRAANLNYAAPTDWRRVALRFAEYAHAGVVAHVWWLDLVQGE